VYTKDPLNMFPFLLEYHLQKDTCVKITLSKYKANKDKIEYSTYHFKNILKKLSFTFEKLCKKKLKSSLVNFHTFKNKIKFKAQKCGEISYMKFPISMNFLLRVGILHVTPTL
jgi:hypothetical protein